MQTVTMQHDQLNSQVEMFSIAAFIVWNWYLVIDTVANRSTHADTEQQNFCTVTCCNIHGSNPIEKVAVYTGSITVLTGNLHFRPVFKELSLLLQLQQRLDHQVHACLSGL